MSTEELKPCPFCGGNADIKYDSGNERYSQIWACGCKACSINFSASGSNSWAGNKKEDEAAKSSAVERWNRRAAAPEPVQAVGQQADEAQGAVAWDFFWLIELRPAFEVHPAFEATYYAGWMETPWEAAKTADPTATPKFTRKEDAEAVAAKLGHTLSCIWTATQHGFSSDRPAQPTADEAQGAVAEWVNEEHGFQYLVPGRLPDGTKLYTHAQPSAEEVTMLKRQIHNLKRHIEDYCPESMPVSGNAGEGVVWPSNAEQVIAFIGPNYDQMVEATTSLEDVKYQLSVHDILSAFYWWLDADPVAQPAAEHAKRAEPNALLGLMAEYWDIAYREGREGGNLSEQANSVLARFRAAIQQQAGEVVAWCEKDGDDWHVYDADSETGKHIAAYQKDTHYVSVFPLFAAAPTLGGEKR